MDLYNKKYLYVNGSSISAAGGFEEYKYRTDIRTAYLDKGIELPKTQIECSYGYHISKELGLELINDSKSGSGIDRLIRTTFDWIIQNSNKVHETIFVLEPQSGIRLDWYVKEWDDYGVLNAHLNEHGKYPFTLVKDWFQDDQMEQQEWNDKYQQSIDSYFDNFFDLDNHFTSEYKRLLWFLSYLNQCKIDYLISIPPMGIDENYSKEIYKHIPKKSNLENIFGHNTGLWEYSRQNNLLISDEVDHTDNHLGYYGNIEIAKKIIEFVKTPNIIKIFHPTKDSNFYHQSHLFFKNSSYKFISSDLNECDFISLENMDKVSIDEDFHDSIKLYSKHKNDINFTSKNFLLFYLHEIHQPDIFEKKLDIITKELNISKSQVFLIDASLLNDRNPNEVPLEFKLKQFSHINNFSGDLFDFKNKKMTYLNHNLPITRFYVLDKVIFEYGDIHKLKTDNNVSVIRINDVIDTENVQNTLTKRMGFYHDVEFYKNLDFPWKVDNFTFHDMEIFYKENQNLHSSSCFSLVCETENEPYIQLIYQSENFKMEFDRKMMQITEKTILSLASGSLVFLIVDKFHYLELEKIGFDFGYLKDIFGIDYKSNSIYENYLDLKKFINVIRDSSIEELNRIRLENKRYIENNVNHAKKIFLGDFSENEHKFINKLIGKNETDIIY